MAEDRARNSDKERYGLPSRAMIVVREERLDKLRVERPLPTARTATDQRVLAPKSTIATSSALSPQPM